VVDEPIETWPRRRTWHTVVITVVIRLRQELRNRRLHWRDPYRCQEAVELVTDYLEGALSPEEIERFEHHLRVCPPCVRYVEQVRRTADVLGRVHPDPPTRTARHALLDAFGDVASRRSPPV